MRSGLDGQGGDAVSEFGETAVDGLEFEQLDILLGLRQVLRDVELL